MDIFEEVYLLFTMPMGLIPGPLRLIDPLYSIEVQKLEEYPAIDVIRTLSNTPDVMLIAQGGTDRYEDWYDWKWRWQRADRFIDIDFSVFDNDGDPVLWGGSQLTPHCTFGDIIWLWSIVRARHPGVWLHDDDCSLLSPRSFLTQYAIPRLQAALADSDERVRNRAAEEIHRYHTVA